LHTSIPNSVDVLGLKAVKESLSFYDLLKPYAWYLLLGLFYLLCTNAALFVTPRLINLTVQLVEGKSIYFNLIFLKMDKIGSLCVCIIFLALGGSLMRLLSRRTLFSVGRYVEKDLRQKLFYHLTLLSRNFYECYSVGDLMTHLTSDINNVRLTAGFAILNLLNVVIIFAGTIPILISISPLLAFTSVLPFVLVIMISQSLNRKMFERVKENQAALSKLTEHVQENLNGAQVIRVFHQEMSEERRFANVNQLNFEAAMSLTKLMTTTFPLTRLMGGLGVAVALFFGGREVVEGRISIGDYVEVNARLLQLSWPALSLGFIWPIFARSRASLARINILLQKEPQIVDGTHKEEVLNSIEAKNLSVEVGKDSFLVLKDLYFYLKAHKIFAVVGPSGSGKSTLMRVLAREILVSKGQLFYNHKSSHEWKLENLYRQLTVVSSEAFLFSASVKDNVAFARPNANEDEINAVIDKVGLQKDIEAFPNGIHTTIGERGVMLSGGQRQRIALARALLLRPKFLLLDDCLSAVDAETESKIVEGLKNEKELACLVIVSHQLSTVRFADEIMVLEKGRIIQRGKHEFLLKNCELYATLWAAEQLEGSIHHG